MIRNAHGIDTHCQNQVISSVLGTMWLEGHIWQSGFKWFKARNLRIQVHFWWPQLTKLCGWKSLLHLCINLLYYCLCFFSADCVFCFGIAIPAGMEPESGHTILFQLIAWNGLLCHEAGWNSLIYPFNQ